MLCFTSIVGNSTSKESIYDTSAITCLNVDILIGNSLNNFGFTIFLSSKILLFMLQRNFVDKIFEPSKINSMLFVKSFSPRKYVMI